MEVSDTVLERFMKKKLRWYEHTQRRNENRWPSWIMDWEQHGRRGKGRPRVGWMRDLEEEMACSLDVERRPTAGDAKN